MGNKNSIPVEAVEGFTIEEVNRLHKRFKKLDKDSNDTLCVEEFLALPELKENPLVQRVVQVFDADSDGELNFSEFVSGLAMFTTKNVDKQKKLKFLFNIYDLDRDGLISNSELFQVVESSGVYFSHLTANIAAGPEDDGRDKLDRDSAPADCGQDSSAAGQGP